MLSAVNTKRLLIGTIILLVVIFGAELIGRLIYETSGAFNGDSPIYWAVGRGLLNGLTLYRDMFDIKPPGIFLVSAFSFGLTDTMRIGHILQAMVFALLPIVIIVPYTTVRWHTSRRWLGLLWMVAFAAAMTMFTAVYAGEFQTESFGALFICLYVATVYIGRDRKSALWPILAGIALFLGLLFKEPFALCAVAAGLLLCRTKQDVIRFIVQPVLIGGALFALVLLSLNVLDEYFSMYLTFLLDDRTARFGTPWHRMALLEVTWTKLWRFSPFIGIPLLGIWLRAWNESAQVSPGFHKRFFSAVGFFIGFGMLLYGMQTFRIFLWSYGIFRGERNWFWLILGLVVMAYNWRSILRAIEHRKRATLLMLRALFVLLSIGYVAGLAGDFIDHHFVFAVPIYMALALLFAEHIAMQEDGLSTFSAVIIACTIIATIVHTRTDYAVRTAQWSADFVNESTLAVQIDSVLDTCNVKQYLIIGEPGTNVFGFTKHSPLGPIFFQHTLATTYPPFSTIFVQELQAAQVLVTTREWRRMHLKGVQEYVQKNFTDQPPPCLQNFTQPKNDILILFRFKEAPITTGSDEQGFPTVKSVDAEKATQK